jgi:hypothetical protein
MAFRRSHYHPYTQSGTYSSIACDVLKGWHYPLHVPIDNINTTTGSMDVKILHVSGPPVVTNPYLSIFSTVFDNGVHITTSPYVLPFFSDPPLILMSPVISTTSVNTVATIGFVNSKSASALNFGAPVIGIYDLTNAPPLGPNNGDRAIYYSDATPAFNNQIFTYNIATSSWFTIAPFVPITGNAVSVFPAGGAYAYGLAYIASLNAPPTYPYVDIHWFPVHVVLDHLSYLVPTWPNYYFPITNNEGLGGVTHAQINSWLDQSVKDTDSPIFNGLNLVIGDSEYDLLLTSITEKDMGGLVQTGLTGDTKTLLSWVPQADGNWNISLLIAGTDPASVDGNYSAFALINVQRALGVTSAPSVQNFVQSSNGTMAASPTYKASFSLNANAFTVTVTGSGVIDFSWRCKLSAVNVN